MSKAIDTPSTSRRGLTRAPDPHQAPPVSIATRRDLFGTMGAMLLLTAAEAGPAKAAELDGELLSCCAEVLAIDCESDRLWDECPMDGGHPAWVAYNAHTDATMPRLSDLVLQISATSARTPEGIRAKAAAARCMMPQDRQDDPDPCERLAMSLYEDLLGRANA